MVLGLRSSRHRKAASVQVDYLVHVGEIRGWPPSQSLRSVRYVLLQWENGDQNSGSLTCGVGDTKIEVNESITLPITLNREKRAHDKFQKNLLEFNLYEPNTDKSAKSQLLGTATLNLAEYGIIEENLTVSVPLNMKKSSKNTVQPILFLNIQPKEVSVDKDVQNYSSDVMNDDESEIASFTDDDVSSHSSKTVTSSSALDASGASPYRSEKDGFEPAMENNHVYVAKSPERKMYMEPVQSVSSFTGRSNTIKESKNPERKTIREDFNEIEEHARISDKLAELASSSKTYNQLDVKSKPNSDDEWRKNGHVKAVPVEDIYVDEEKSQEEIERDERILEEMRASVNKQTSKFSQSGIKRQGALRSTTLASDRRAVGATTSNNNNNNKLKHMKSVQLPPHSPQTNGYPKGIRKVDNVTTNNVATDFKKVDDRVEMLEEELKEAAAIEVGLYSIVAEHGSSVNKVHAPARRLSRFYLHACKATTSKYKRASSARAITSGLVLVSKACGNDVPRLTFWLSNSIMLRAIVKQSIEELHISDGEEVADYIEECDEWQDPKTFMVALEKIEGWIFSRIVESVWWQTLTPHMQYSAAASSSRSAISNSRKNSGKRLGSGDQEQGNFSIELWKKAFRDACERLCPIRAGGHECGCLPVARLVMGQLVSRLDVAMFNAILRESDEEMPTDPVSDPIGDSKVLPIPSGKTSFGSGAQLKNAIGNWSRWLTDLFGIEDSDSAEENSKRPEFDTSSLKPFRLLNALSDLMMLPSEMLADASTRKEFCPIFGTPLIKRVVWNFVPDEFCPNPIPESVLQALDTEEDDMGEGDCLTSYPCAAKATVYRAPAAASLAGMIGQVGSSLERSKSSSVLKKAYTSDDELDELDSPLASIFNDKFRPTSGEATDNWIPKGKGGRKVVRYQLLRQVWGDGEY